MRAGPCVWCACFTAPTMTDPVGTDPTVVGTGAGSPFPARNTGVAMRLRSARTAVAALLVAVLGMAGCQPSANAGGSASVSPSFSLDPLKHMPWAASIATAAIPTDAAPGPMIEADGAIWVAAHRGGFLDRIDPATNT